VKLMLLGDSWVEGADGSESFVPYLRQLLPCSVILEGSRQINDDKLLTIRHEGHAGYGVDEVLANLDAWLRFSMPHVVALMIGANDLPYFSAPQMADRVLRLVRNIAARGIFVLLCGIPPVIGFESKVKDVNALLASRARVIDLDILDYPTDYFDKAHPNAAGARKIAILLANILSKVPGVQFRDGDDNRIFVGGTGWAPSDYRELAQVAESIRANAGDLLLVLFSESRLNPAATNGSARGLNQLTPIALPCAGATTAEHASMTEMSVAQQLPFVRRYFQCNSWWKAGGGYETAARLYTANAAPQFVGAASMDAVIYDSNGATPKNYWANTGLDSEKKGYVTIRDLARTLVHNEKDPAFRAHLAALADATGAEQFVYLPDGIGSSGPRRARAAGSSTFATTIALGLLAAGAVRYFRL